MKSWEINKPFTTSDGKRGFSIWIPVVFPGRNESEGEARSHKMDGAKLKKKYTSVAAVFISTRLRSDWRPIQRYSVAFLWVCKDQRHDPDNVIAGSKYVLDGMVKAGLVAGDAWRNVVKIENSFVVNKENPGVQISIVVET